MAIRPNICSGTMTGFVLTFLVFHGVSLHPAKDARTGPSYSADETMTALVSVASRIKGNVVPRCPTGQSVSPSTPSVSTPS